MKMLITGGAGFIGSNYVRHAIANGHHVLNVDKLTYSGNRNNLKGLDKRKHLLIQADICDEGLMRRVMKDAEIVVHFAAESHVTRSEKNPVRFFETNVEGTRILLESAVDSRIKKFIHVSTDEVYGSKKSGSFKEEDKLPGEEQASSVYARSKALADDYALSFSFKIPVVVIRPTNNFGPYQYPEKALPRWITRLIMGKKIPVWGKGENVRDWLYVGDTCKAIDLLIEKGKVGEAYNVAANNDPEIRNIDMARWLVNYFGLGEEFISLVPDPRPKHDLRYSLDIEKINELGYKPNPNTKALIFQTAEWYKKNKWWWKPLIKEAESIYSDIKDGKRKNKKG